MNFTNLKLEEEEPVTKRGTKIWRVYWTENRLLGTIYWFSLTKQYQLATDVPTVLGIADMEQLAEFCSTETQAHLEKQ